MSPRRLFHWSEVALGGLVVALAARTLILHRELGVARGELGRLRVAHATLLSDTRLLEEDVRSLRQLAQGSQISEEASLRGYTLGGRAVVIRLAHLTSPHLFFTVDQKCALCSTWRAFLRESARERPCSLNILGIALNDTPSPSWYADSTGFDLIVRSTGVAWTTLALETPATAILVGPRGRFLGRWVGAADHLTVAEIQRAVQATCGGAARDTNDLHP